MRTRTRCQRDPCTVNTMHGVAVRLCRRARGARIDSEWARGSGRRTCRDNKWCRLHHLRLPSQNSVARLVEHSPPARRGPLRLQRACVSGSLCGQLAPCRNQKVSHFRTRGKHSPPQVREQWMAWGALVDDLAAHNPHAAHPNHSEAQPPADVDPLPVLNTRESSFDSRIQKGLEQVKRVAREANLPGIERTLHALRRSLIPTNFGVLWFWHLAVFPTCPRRKRASCSHSAKNSISSPGISTTRRLLTCRHCSTPNLALTTKITCVANPRSSSTCLTSKVVEVSTPVGKLSNSIKPGTRCLQSCTRSWSKPTETFVSQVQTR